MDVGYIECFVYRLCFENIIALKVFLTLSELTGNELDCKRESQKSVFSLTDFRKSPLRSTLNFLGPRKRAV